MSWINSPDDLINVAAFTALIAVLIVVSASSLGGIVTSATVYIAVIILLFTFLHKGREDQFVGRTLVSVFDRETEPGAMWMNIYAGDKSECQDLTEEEKREKLEEDIKKAADESVPVGTMLIVSILLIIALIYNKGHFLPTQAYGLILNGAGGLLLAIDRPHKLGTTTINPEYRTKQALQGIWGALLLLFGFILQILAVLAGSPPS